MRPLRALAIYIAVVFLGGALIAPGLYSMAQSFAHSVPALADSPFHRFVNRSLLGVALFGLWPLLRSLGATSFRDIGFVKPAGQWKRFGAGFALGFLSLALVAIMTLAAGARAMAGDASAARLGQKIISAAITAVIVAVLEEVL